MASRRWDILALPGVEITHTPKEDIDLLAREARALGAKVVNVHGETIVEPVEPGTNRAAVSSRHVNILAHPGLITPDEAANRGGERRLPRNLFTQRAQPHQRPRGACGARGERRHGVGLGHPRGLATLLTREHALRVARGAGLDEREALALSTTTRAPSSPVWASSMAGERGDPH